MYARVITVQVQPGKLEDLLQVLQEQVIPAAQHQPGFRGLLRLTDQRTGKGMTVSLWESEADLIASETSGYLQEMRAITAPFYVMPPFREVYEVSLQVTAPSSAEQPPAPEAV